jgi:calcium-dependent protein kinase
MSTIPGNFMLLTEAEDSPIKALDFGLAVFFDPKVRCWGGL